MNDRHQVTHSRTSENAKRGAHKETDEQRHSKAGHSELLKNRDKAILTRACWGQEGNRRRG